MFSGVGVRRQIVGREGLPALREAAGAESPHGAFVRGRASMSNQARLFVGNLSYRTMENDLQDFFSQAGVVTSVNIMYDKFTGRSRGFAFVEYASSEEANKAVELFHGKEFQGRSLTVNVARPREERPSASASAQRDVVQ
jgi:RNA recognition motif-containing protein